MSTDGLRGSVCSEIQTIIAAKELGCSIFDLLDNPDGLFYRNLALAKLATENKVQKQKEAKNRQKQTQKNRYRR